MGLHPAEIPLASGRAALPSRRPALPSGLRAADRVTAGRDRDRYRELMLRTVSWLIRAGAYGLIGVDVFLRASLGPVALPVTVAAYALCGVLLVVCAAVINRSGTAPALPVLLGLITVVSAGVCAQEDVTSLVALGVIAVLDAGTEARLTAAWAVFGAGVVAAEAGALLTDASPAKALGIPLLLMLGLLAGFNRRAYRVRADQSAALLAQSEELRARSEELRAEQRRGAVLDERTRIAREIHDVLAHSIGALGIQIQAARALLADTPDVERADGVLAVAQRMASDGLTETRRAVHALRTDTLPLDEELARMTTIHEQRHGTPVALRVDGGPVPLPPDQTLALVRTAQESLVNAAKHAPHQPVTLTLTYGDDNVTMSIANPLGAAAAHGFATLDGGYGLTGMRERLLLLGGTLTADAADGRRWTVTATVPR